MGYILRMLEFPPSKAAPMIGKERLCRCLLLISAVSLLIAPALGQVVPPAPQMLPTPLTLNDAISIALSHQPQQYIALAQKSQALGQKQQAQSQYFPALTPSYQYQNRSQTLYGVATPSSTGTIGNSNVVTAVRGGGLSLGLTENLYDGGKREAANAQARRALDAADNNNRNTIQNTILMVTQDYYQLLLAIDLVKVAQAQVARYQQTVDVTQAQIEAGTTAAKDIYQARSDLANAQVTLLQNQNGIHTASATLKNALGVATDATVQPAPLAADNGLPPPPVSAQNLSFDAALQLAYDSRPDLRQQEATVQSQTAALQQARRGAGLTLSSDYALTYQATNDTGARGLDSQLLVTGSYPLFDAGSARGAVRIAQAQRDVAQNQLEQVRQQIRLDVEQAYSTRETNLQAAQLAQAAVTAAQVNYDAVIAARREGIGTVLDITTAQATLTQAQSQYVSAVYNFYIADAALQRAIGRNDAAVVSSH